MFLLSNHLPLYVGSMSVTTVHTEKLRQPTMTPKIKLKLFAGTKSSKKVLFPHEAVNSIEFLLRDRKKHGTSKENVLSMAHQVNFLPYFSSPVLNLSILIIYIYIYLSLVLRTCRQSICKLAYVCIINLFFINYRLCL